MQTFDSGFILLHQDLGALDPLHDGLVARGRERGEDGRRSLLQMVLRSRAEGFYRTVHIVSTSSSVDVHFDPPWDDVRASCIQEACSLDREVGIQNGLDLLAFDEDTPSVDPA